MPTAPHEPYPYDPALTDDALTDRVRVWQRRRGHRYSVDDVVTGWIACRARPASSVNAYVDLGCGIGSVLLMVCDRARPNNAVGIEAQFESFLLAQRNVQRNRLATRLTVHHGDLRDHALIERVLQAAPGGYELVTGTPPYKALGAATMSPDPQRAHARVELRGGVEAYLQAAAGVLSANGSFVMCAEMALDARVTAGAAAAGLRIARRTDVVPMAGRKAHLFAVYECVGVSSQHGAASDPIVSELVLRHADGTRSADAHAMRAFFGLPSNPDELPSPPRGQPPRSEGLHVRRRDG